MSGSGDIAKGSSDRRILRFIGAIVLGILLIHACLLFRLAVLHTPTIDETAHLPAGISHWTLGRYDLYRVNPPLVRMLAALPVLFVDAETDWSAFSETPGSRPEFEIGRAFIEANGESAFDYYTLARWVGILFSVIGGYVCFRWASDLWGWPSGLVALTLWCFDPNILGNAQSIQPDVPAAAMAVWIAYSYWVWFRKPTVRAAVVTGILLGIGFLTKTTLVFMVPLLVVLSVYRWIAYRPMKEFGLGHTTLHPLLMFGIGVYILNLGFVFDGSFRTLGSYDFVSASLRPETSVRTQSNYVGMGNRFTGTLLGRVPVPLPKDFVQGIDEQKRDFEGRLRSYLRGETRRTGWWYYYLYAMLIKIPIGTWLLLAIGTGLLWRFGPGDWGWPPVVIVTCTGATFLLAVSSVTGMTQHMRYVLPVFPFLFIVASGAARILSSVNARWIRCLTAIGLAMSVTSSLATFPHCHSYFNELIGGPRNGHFHLLSSNIDYGEDLFFLRDWLEENGSGRPITLAYFGNFDPRLVGIQFRTPPKQPTPGLHAISVNYLHGTSVPLPDGQGGRSYSDDYSAYLQFEPVASAGYGILIYDIPEHEGY